LSDVLITTNNVAGIETGFKNSNWYAEGPPVKGEILYLSIRIGVSEFSSKIPSPLSWYITTPHCFSASLLK